MEHSISFELYQCIFVSIISLINMKRTVLFYFVSPTQTDFNKIKLLVEIKNATKKTVIMFRSLQICFFLRP